jgi:hypothetical protein
MRTPLPGTRREGGLVVTRLTDLATVDDESLRPAIASLLTELIRLAHTTDVDDYKQVVTYAFEYGYEKQFGENLLRERTGSSGSDRCDQDL